MDGTVANASALVRFVQTVKCGEDVGVAVRTRTEGLRAAADFVRRGIEQHARFACFMKPDVAEALEALVRDGTPAGGVFRADSAISGVAPAGRRSVADTPTVRDWVAAVSQSVCAHQSAENGPLYVIADLCDVLGAGDVVEYVAEAAQLSSTFAQRAAAGMFLYDLEQLTSDKLIELLRLHSRVYWDGRVVAGMENRRPASALEGREEFVAEEFFDLSLALLCVAGTDGYFKRVNQAFETTLGYSAEELLERPFIEWVHPEDRDATVAEVHKLARGIPTVSFVNRYRHKHGGYRRLAWTAIPVEGTTQFYCTAVDITEREQAHSALRHAHRELEQRVRSRTAELAAVNEHLRREIAEREAAQGALQRERDLLDGILRTSVAAVTVMDTAGQIVFANDRAQEILGVSRNELVGRTYNAPAWEIRDLSGQPLADEDLPFQRVLATGQPVFDVPHVIGLPDGTQRTLLINAAPLRDARGALTGVVATETDITARRLDEEALRRSEQLARNVIEGIPIGVWVGDRDFNIQIWNVGQERMTGTSRADVLGRNIFELFPSLERSGLRAMYERVIETGEPLVLDEFAFQDSMLSRGEYFLNIRATALKDVAGEVTGILLAVEDITERKQAAERIEHLNAVLRAIRKVSKLVYSESDPQRLLQRACESLTETRGYQCAWVALVDDERRLVQFVHSGLSIVHEGLLGSALPKCAAEALDSDGVVAYRQCSERDACPLDDVDSGHAALLVRLEHQDRTYGVLTVALPDTLVDDPEERELFEAVADDIALALYGIEVEQDRRWAETALAESEHRHRVITELVSDYAYGGRLSETGYAEAKWISGAFERITGYTPEEIARLDNGWWSVALPEALDKFNAALPELRARRPVTLEYRVRRRDGDIRWLRDYIRPVWNEEDGCVTELLGGVQDVTERKRTEEALRFQATLLDQIGDNVIATDLDGYITYVNGAVARMLHTSREELRGRHVSELGEDPARGARQQDIVEHTRQHGFWHGEVVNRRADGRDVILYCRTRLLYDDTGQPTGMCGVSTDITERKRVEQERIEFERQLQHAQKLESLGVLAGGIAHDFNNLLVGVLGNASLALDEMPSDSPVRDLIERIEAAAHRAADLTRQMLAYSGKGKFVVSPVHLSNLVRDLTRLLDVSISKRASVVYDLPDDLPLADADQTQINQVVMNLIINASEALEDCNGTITVRTGALCVADESIACEGNHRLMPGEYVFIEVSDTGCGMDADTRAKLFDPFFTTKFTGRGLGLAAVLGIVRGHHGGIQVDSQLGEGTTFRVLLPRSQAASKPEKADIDASHEGVAGGTILVADDEESVCLVARQGLERCGFEVLTVHNGEDAVRTFREHADVIRAAVIDLTMPGLDGRQVLRELHALRSDLPVLLCSGYAGENAPAHEFGGRAEFVQKPYTPMMLVKQIRKMLAHG